MMKIEAEKQRVNSDSGKVTSADVNYVDEKSPPPCLEHIIRPLLVGMSMFGLYFSNETSPRSGCKWRPLKIYCLLTVFILFAGIYNTTHYTHHISAKKSVEIGIWVLTITFYVMNSVTAVVMVVLCLSNSIPNLLKSWRDIQDLKYNNVHKNRFITKAQYTSLAVITILLVSGFIMTLIRFINTIDHSTSFGKILFIIWSIIFELFHMGVWGFVALFIFVLSCAICAEFKSFREDFQKHISPNARFTGDLGEFRQRHQRICRHVEKVDDLLCILLGLGIFINTLQILLALFVGVWHSADTANPKELSVMVHWIVSAVVIAFMLCVSGASVNHTAHSPLSDVYQIDVRGDVVLATEIRLFLSRLTGGHIGLTALKLFVVDKSTILKVFGLLLTYYVVLVQFQTDDEPRYLDHCNNTTGT